jgi:ATP-binding cassette subfamily C (CFTR/MRP) protein 1
MADFFIRWWTRDYYNKYNEDCTGFYCGGMFYVKYYGILGPFLFIVLMLFRGSFLYLWCMGAAQRIHVKGIHRVLYAPLGFFFSVSIFTSS